MPFTWSYLYLNKPNMCTCTWLSNSVDSAQYINSKLLRASPLAGIFKNAAFIVELV